MDRILEDRNFENGAVIPTEQPIIGWRIWAVRDGWLCPAIKPTSSWPKKKELKAICAFCAPYLDEHEAPDYRCQYGVRLSLIRAATEFRKFISEAPIRNDFSVAIAAQYNGTVEVAKIAAAFEFNNQQFLMRYIASYALLDAVSELFTIQQEHKNEHWGIHEAVRALLAREAKGSMLDDAATLTLNRIDAYYGMRPTPPFVIDPAKCTV